ncbi:hypothetical protein JXJ21_18600, partial [candidate division KSB1 bacterium]|nr:hypothetical protein [candidate division KSB1 bacterium]
METQNCYLCDSPAECHNALGYIHMPQVKCNSCGSYKISFDASLQLEKIQDQRYILSGITRRATEKNTILTISTENLNELLNTAPIP